MFSSDKADYSSNMTSVAGLLVNVTINLLPHAIVTVAMWCHRSKTPAEHLVSMFIRENIFIDLFWWGLGSDHSSCKKKSRIETNVFDEWLKLTAGSEILCSSRENSQENLQRLSRAFAAKVLKGHLIKWMYKNCT